jgi:hypothetical protein
MRLLIGANRLKGKQLQFRKLFQGDHLVEIDGLRAGWILGPPAGNDPPVWLWTMTGPACSMAMVDKTGQCGLFTDAKTEFSAAFNRWLTWALEQPDPVTWFEPTPPQDGTEGRKGP